MIREEAIESLRGILTEAVEFENSVCYVTEEDREPLEMAIKALEQEPCPNAISRSDMLDAVGHGTTYTSEELQRIIKALLPVDPQPKTGHWKYYRNNKGDWVNECSVCGLDAGVGYRYPYCPNCGAKMVEPQESEEA